MAEPINALTMSEENPYYKKYLKNKDKIQKIVAKKREKFDRKMARRAHRKHEEIKVEPFVSDDPYDENEFLFLSFMTRKYFKDGCIFSTFKMLFGILALTATILMIELELFRGVIRSILSTACLGYGVIMTPLGLLYLIAHFICFCRYENYMTTRTSRLSQKIIHFYDENTDKFAAVNWANVISRDNNVYKERHRTRGW